MNKYKCDGIKYQMYPCMERTPFAMDMLNSSNRIQNAICLYTNVDFSSTLLFLFAPFHSIFAVHYIIFFLLFDVSVLVLFVCNNSRFVQPASHFLQPRTRMLKKQSNRKH